MVLSGQPYNTPGSVAPWKLPGGLAALKARSRGGGAWKGMIVGVGGPNVPKVEPSVDLDKLRVEHAEELQQLASLLVPSLPTSFFCSLF